MLQIAKCRGTKKQQLEDHEDPKSSLHPIRKPYMTLLIGWNYSPLQLKSFSAMGQKVVCPPNQPEFCSFFFSPTLFLFQVTFSPMNALTSGLLQQFDLKEKRFQWMILSPSPGLCALKNGSLAFGNAVEALRYGSF